MEYTLDQFQLLVTLAEEQGGAHLPDTCEGEIIEYEIQGKKNPVRSCSCGNDTMFAVAYDPLPDTKSKRPPFVRLCGVCDGMGWMPRFDEVQDA